MTEHVLYLPEVDNTIAYAKAHFAEFAPVGAVYTTSQTAGRGRLGSAWTNNAGEALYYTAVIKTPPLSLVQPAALPLLASLAVQDALRVRYSAVCQIKWPNDILLNGKKLVGILCEGLPGNRGILCGIGINLAQPQSAFDAAGLPHATSLALQGVPVDPAADAEWLAQYLTDFGFDRPLFRFEREGFAPFRDAYKAACVNLGRHVVFDGGEGTATDIDGEGRLIVQGADGTQRVFTGEVRVRGIYGSL